MSRKGCPIKETPSFLGIEGCQSIKKASRSPRTINLSLFCYNPPSSNNWQSKWGRVNGAECLSGRSKKLSNAPKSFSTLSLRPNSKTLKVRFVTTEDAGIFECQVSTSPKLSLIFRLAVLGGRMMRKKCKSIFRRGNDDDDDENMASLSIISYPWESSFLTMCQYLDSAACWRP